MTSSQIETTHKHIKTPVRIHSEQTPNVTSHGLRRAPDSTPTETHFSRKKPHFPSDWPIVASRNADMHVPVEIFRSGNYGDKYVPGTKREIYVGASRGVGRLAKLLAMPLYKISTCGEGRLIERMLELRADRYGSAWLSEGRQMLQDHGFDDWFPSNFQTAATAAHSPVTTAPRHITVTLPHDMPPEQFDVEFEAEIREAAIDRWAMTPEGRDHCLSKGVDPSIAIRMTPYRYDASEVNSPAREICCFRPSKDGDRLVAIAELIVLRHLGILPRPENKHH